MTRSRPHTAASIALVFAATLTQEMTVVAQSASPRAWGTSVGGLRVAIALVSDPVPVEDVRFEISLQNVGDLDFVLNLGTMLANGRMMSPYALHLVVTDPAGKTRELDYADRRHGGVAGRIDDYFVALPAGATYVLPVSLGSFWSPATKEFVMPALPGRHRIHVRFDGSGASAVTADMKGVMLMNFWKGSVTSGTLQFDTP